MMGTRQVETINGIRCFTDSDSPGNSLGFAYATGEGGEVLYSVSDYLCIAAPTINAITDPGSGIIISAAERTSLHGHANKSVIDLITAAGSGIVISALERTTIGTNTTLATHANRAILDGITNVGSGAIITSAERGLIASMSGSTNYRGGLAGNADLTGNSTGNTYLDGGTDILVGDLFVVTSNGTLTTNTGTNIAVVIGDHVYIENTTTDSTIVDGDIDVVSVGAAGVTSIDFGGGGGVQSGVIAIDSDNIGEGTTNLFLTSDERADIATIDGLAVTVGNNTTLGTHSNRTQLDLITSAGSGIIISAGERTTIGDNTTLATHANRAALDNIVSAGSGTIVSASERSALTILRGAKTSGQIIKATGTGVLDFGWGTDEGGAGTVSSVNTVLPVAGDVTLTMGNMTETASAKILTNLERASISTTALTTAGNSTQIARIRNNAAISFSTALAIDAENQKNGLVILTDNTKPALVANMSDGETYRLVAIQDSSGARHIDWDNYNADPEVLTRPSKQAGARTTYLIHQEATGVQDVSVVGTDGPSTSRMITWPAGPGTGLGGGASSIVSNVNSAVWTWPQVRKYQFYGLTDLCRAASIDYTQVQTVAANAPELQCLTFLRPDIWQFWNRYGTDNPSLQWGTFLSGQKPTAAMGDAGRDGNAFSTALATILDSGGANYALNSEVSTITNAGALLTNPYEMEFFEPLTTHEFRVQSNLMDIRDQNWLDLYTDFIVAVRQLWPLVKGYALFPVKMQFYQNETRVATYQLHEWIEGTANPGWDLATNSGGTLKPDGENFGWDVNRTQYDDHESAQTIKDAFDSMKDLALLLREKDPHAVLYCTPYYLGVNGHRNTEYRADYQTAYIAEFGGTTTDADNYWSAFLSEMANICDYVAHFADDDADDFSADWSQQLRVNGKWVLENVKPQDISVLSNQ
jgi:hypothetical protein